MGAMQRRARCTVRRPAGFWGRASRGLAFCGVTQVERSGQAMDIFESGADGICFAQIPAGT